MKHKFSSFLTASLKAIPPGVPHVTVALSVHLYVCMSSDTVMHSAKAVGRIEMPFGRDIRVISSNIVLDRGPGSPRKGKVWGRNRNNNQTQL